MFSRAFSSEVQPVELARKLAKEMDAHKTASVQRVYVPNEYTVFLSRQDRSKLEGYERSLEQELSGYLLEHAPADMRVVISTRADPPLALSRLRAHGELAELGATVFGLSTQPHDEQVAVAELLGTVPSGPRAPSKALVDGPQALTLEELPYFLDDVQIAREAYEKRCELAARRTTPSA